MNTPLTQEEPKNQTRESSVLGDWNWYLPKWLEWLPQRQPKIRVPVPKVKPEPTPTPGPA